MLDAPFLQANLERQEQREQKLVALVQSPAGVLEHLKGQELDDVVDSLGRNGGLVRPEEVQNTKLLWQQRNFFSLRLVFISRTQKNNVLMKKITK